MGTRIPCFIMVIALIFSAGCSGGSKSNDAKVVPVTGISLNSTASPIIIGNSVQLTATVEPPNATNRDITWISNKPEIAEVDAAGLVKGNAAGNAIITATADGGKTATCTITVSAVIVTITLDWQGWGPPSGYTSSYSYEKGAVTNLYNNTPSRPGSYFQGWYSLSGGHGVAFLNGSAATADMTLYAYWIIQVCGDGIKQGLEQCDDGNTTSGDGCSSVCTIE